MTDRFGQELSNLSRTYQWSLTTPIEKLTAFIQNCHELPLLSIGSGGSFTAAQMAALLHLRTGMMANAITPLSLTSFDSALQNAAVLFFTASGRNSDILSAFRYTSLSDARRVMALCMNQNSPLSQLSRKFQFTENLEFEPPIQKDGFLATNSLLAFLINLLRA